MELRERKRVSDCVSTRLKSRVGTSKRCHTTRRLVTMKDVSSAKQKVRAERHKPLASQIIGDQVVKTKSKQPKERQRQGESEVWSK